MDLITVEDVIRAIEVHFDGGAISYLSSRESAQYRTTVVAY
jgi:hypothetical protein